MIRYASTVDTEEYKAIDNLFLQYSSDWRTRPKIRMSKARFFEPTFVLRYWSAFMHEFECLTNDERKFAVATYLAPHHVRVSGLPNRPSYCESSLAAGQREALGADRFRSNRDYYEIMDKVRQEGYTRLNELVKYDLARRTFVISDAQRLENEAYFSAEYHLIKSVFWMRYLARVAEFATPTVKKSIREELVRCSHTISLVEELFKNNPKDKAILMEHLTSPVPGFRKKYGRVDVSLKEYWDV